MQRSKRSFEKNGCLSLEIKEILDKQTFFGPGKRGIHLFYPLPQVPEQIVYAKLIPLDPFSPSISL